MTHVVCQVENAASSKQLIAALVGEGVSLEHITAIAKDTTPLDMLPDEVTEGNELVESDVIPGLQRGAAFGGATGLLAGLGAAIFAPLGIAVGGAGLAMMAATGASFGAFVSALIGSSVSNSELREFEAALERGEVLLVIGEVDQNRPKLEALIADQFKSVTVLGDTHGAPPAV